MSANDRRLRENAAEWHPITTSNAEVLNQAKTDDMGCEVKEERKVQVEEWATPNGYARADNDAKAHDNNEEEKLT